MIAFDLSTRYMTVALAGAVATTEPQWISSWEDGATGPIGTDFGSTSGTTDVTVLPAPASQAQGTRRLVSFSLYNRDTAAVTVTVTYRDSSDSSAYTLQAVTLQAGESLMYEENSGWSGLDVSGNQKVASNTVQVSTALSMASTASSAASVASSMASRGLASVAQASTSVSAVSSALSVTNVSGVVASSVASRVKSSFGW